MIEKVIGSLYDKLEKWDLYLVQLLDYEDYEDWMDKVFKYMIIPLEILDEFYHSNLNIPQNLHLWN
jgi:hypothetical protein